MSKNIILNGQTFNNASYLEAETTDGNKALFRETSEIATPSGSMEITENGTFDVTNVAQALVNVVGGASTGQAITGFIETKASNQTFLDLPIGEVDTDKFLVFIQLVESGTYATPGDSSSELTIDETVTGIDSSNWTIAYVLYMTNPFDTDVEYQQTELVKTNAIRGGITTTNKTNSAIAIVLQSYSDGVLKISNLSYSTGHTSKYLKYAYTVYPLG